MQQVYGPIVPKVKYPQLLYSFFKMAYSSNSPLVNTHVSQQHVYQKHIKFHNFDPIKSTYQRTKPTSLSKTMKRWSTGGWGQHKGQETNALYNNCRLYARLAKVSSQISSVDEPLERGCKLN